MDIWQILLPAGLLLLGLAGFFLSSSSRYLTIREQAALTAFLTRELDQMHGKITTLEQTRPTTGELQAMMSKKNGN